MVYQNTSPSVPRLDDWWVNRTTQSNTLSFPVPSPISLGRHSLEFMVEHFERGIIAKALEASRGNQTKAARLLLTTKRVIQYKVKKYRIDYRQYRRYGQMQ